MYYVKTNDLYSAINTALSAKQHGVEIHLVTDKKVENDLFTSINGDMEDGKEIPAGSLFLKAPGKSIKIFKGDKHFSNMGEGLKGYTLLELTDNSINQWWDYYNAKVQSLGGYTTNFLWRK